MATKQKAAQPATTAPPAPRRQLIKASDVRPESVEWLWKERIPKGKITLIGGRPKQGKSLATAMIAADVTKSGGAVIISNPEDAKADTQVPRLMAAGADTRLVHFWPGKLRLPSDLEDLEALVHFHGVKLVIIDPIRKHCETSDPSLSLEPLAAMCERTGCAAVIVHHLNKKATKTEHPMDAFGGALSDYVGTARAVYAFGPVGGTAEPEARFMTPVAMNVGSSETSVEFYLDGDVEVDLPNGDVVTPGRVVFVSDKSKTDALAVVMYAGGFGYKNESPEKKQVAAEFLALVLANGPMAVNDVFDKAAEAGVSKMTMRRAADDLGVVKKRVGFGPGSYLNWELPAGHPALKVMASLMPQSSGDEDDDGVDAAIAKILGGGDDE